MSSLIGLQVEARRLEGQTVIVEFQGELDISTAPKAREAIVAFLAEGCRHLIVNLHKIDYIDSTGLGALVGALRRAREQGGELRLVGLSGRVRRLFEITHLTFAFPIDSNVESALAQIGTARVSTTT